MTSTIEAGSGIAPGSGAHDRVQVAVVGAGPAGLTAALSLAGTGAQVTCLGPGLSHGSNHDDTRTSALLDASVRLLERNDVWKTCAPQAAPLEAIRLIDDTGRLIRAPEVVFRAAELGLPAFGYNVPNSALVSALIDRARAMNNVALVETEGATRVEPDSHEVRITLKEGGTHRARLVVGADGRRSTCRSAAGITAATWSYSQSAIACNFEHGAPHSNVSNELHRPAGPFTTVPLPGNASSLVWVERPDEAERLMALDGHAFAGELERRLQGLLGPIRAVGRRAAFPLSGLSVGRMADRRIALVGEAAHVIPPIGAQGLNLGFRDAATLADLVAGAIARDEDIGGRPLIEAYARARAGDVASRTLAVDLLNRSVLAGFVPLQAARGLGLQLLASFAPLRNVIMRAGLASGNGLPDAPRDSG